MQGYNCYDYALELGFTEEEARSLQASKMGKGQDATVLRRLAAVKGLASMKPIYPMSSHAPQSKPRLAEPIASSKPPAKPKRKPRAKPTK